MTARCSVHASIDVLMVPSNELRELRWNPGLHFHIRLFSEIQETQRTCGPITALLPSHQHRCPPPPSTAVHHTMTVMASINFCGATSAVESVVTFRKGHYGGYGDGMSIIRRCREEQTNVPPWANEPGAANISGPFLFTIHIWLNTSEGTLI